MSLGNATAAGPRGYGIASLSEMAFYPPASGGGGVAVNDIARKRANGVTVLRRVLCLGVRIPCLPVSVNLHLLSNMAALGA